jgi:uncharacterized protein (UPF0264 family)
MGKHLKQCEHIGQRPGLLVSVRSAAEAVAALAGGADVIDVKEPLRGPLGPADGETIAEVVRAVAGRVPVTAAAGELTDVNTSVLMTSPAEIALVKFGLANCSSMGCLRSALRRRFSHGCDHTPTAIVAYADWRAARSIDPVAVLSAAIEFGCAAVLIDTWDKSAGTLFDHWPADGLMMYLHQSREHGLLVALAGSLTLENLRDAAALGPDYVAVRGAACEGGRAGAVSAKRVAALRAALAVSEVSASGVT